MSQKTLVIAVVVVVIIAVVAVGVYLAMSGGGGGPTPTGTPTSTPSGADVEGASSLQFSVDITQQGTSLGSYTYKAKNIGTDNMMLRVEITSDAGNMVYIVNGAQHKAWGYVGGTWTDLSDTFSDQWDSWNATWSDYKGKLADWTTGDWTYTSPDGSTVRIYNIMVNPTLADSLFQP